MKKLLLVVCIVFLLLGVSLSGGAVIIHPGTQFVVGNETYTVNATMVFSSITISSNFIIFNTTGFYVSSPNSITITLVTINDDIPGAANGEKILDFYAAATAGTVWFNLSGFSASTEYIVKRNSVTLTTSTANASGYISFSNNAWSTYRFQIYQQTAAPSDTIDPVITSIDSTESNPLDTQEGYGWENVTCQVTDNVGVETVVLQITYPDDTSTNVIMTKKSGTNTYYSNQSFSQHGNYTYRIHATDTSDNSVVSSSQMISLPPNWDMNNDGECTILDLVLVSNRYGQSGSPGWVREDSDNNGEVEVLDIVLVSGHFGESWWE